MDMEQGRNVNDANIIFPYVKGWLAQSPTNQKILRDTTLVYPGADGISSFSWATLTPKKIVVDDFSLTVSPDYSGGKTFTQIKTGVNNSKNALGLTVQLVQADAFEITLTTSKTFTSNYTVSASFSFEGGVTVGQGTPVASTSKKFTLTIGGSVSLDFSEKNENSQTSRSSYQIQESQSVSVPPQSYYSGSLAVNIATVGPTPFEAISHCWFDARIPDAEYDAATGWWQVKYPITGILSGGVRSQVLFNSQAWPISPASAPNQYDFGVVYGGGGGVPHTTLIPNGTIATGISVDYQTWVVSGISLWVGSIVYRFGGWAQGDFSTGLIPLGTTSVKSIRLFYDTEIRGVIITLNNGAVFGPYGVSDTATNTSYKTIELEAKGPLLVGFKGKSGADMDALGLITLRVDPGSFGVLTELSDHHPD